MNVLAKVQRQRIRFLATDKDHLQEFRNFVINGKWEKGCPFELEWPYLSIPDMIKDRIINHYLEI